MTILPLDLSRFSDFWAIYLVRWTYHSADARLENLSNESLKDIGIEPYRHDFDTVKPFWMP
jgi:uncharacterized protein YjiS (DUF1127 family)